MSSQPPADAHNAQSMRAWLYSSTSGGLEHNLKLTSTTPRPGQPLPKDQILVKVRCMSVNHADYKVPELPGARFVVPTPACPGLDYAGTVEGVGAAVDTFRVGERVFGKLDAGRQGSLSDYITVKQDQCAGLPDAMDWERGSCVATGGLTAYQSIAPNVKEGDKVFINGGSGGVGTIGIQIARALGCHVTVSCSGANVSMCRSLGVEDVIDYTKEDVSKTLKGKGQIYKLVVDNVGSSPPDLYKAADHFLLPEGKFVQVGGTPADAKVILTRAFVPSFLGGGKRKFEFLVQKTRHDHLVEIAKLMQEGKIKPVVDQVFEFEDAPKAYERLRAGGTKGKLVVRVTKEA